LRQSLERLEQQVVEVKQAEESLRRANETLQALFDYSPLAINLLDLDNRVLFWNHAAEKMYGWTAQEVLGKFLPIVSEEKLEEHRAMRERVCQGESFTNLEVERNRKDGSTFSLDVSIAPLRDANGNPYAMVSIAMDITERKRAEEALQESEQRFRTLAEASFEGIALTERGVFVDLNDQLAQMLGYAQSELIGQPVMKVVAPESRGLVTEAIRSGRLEPYEHLALRKDGTTFPADTRARVTPMVGRQLRITAIRDITERKRAEQALRESEERYRSLFENSPISLWEEDFSLVKGYFDELRVMGVTDLRAFFENHPEEVTHCTGLVKVLDVNKATVALVGVRDKDELLAWLSNVLADEALGVFREELITLAEGGQWFESESVHRTLSGEERSIALNLSVAPGFANSLGKVLVSVLDITERKQAEAQLERNLRETRVRYEVSQALAGAETEDEVLDVLIQHASLYPQAFVAIMTFDWRGAERTAIVRRQDTFESGLTATAPIGGRLPPSIYTISRHHSADKPFVSEDVFADARVDPATREIFRQTGAGSLTFVPLMAENEWMGFIGAMAKHTSYFDEEKQHLYQTLAEQGAVALRAARLRAAVRESQQRFQGLVETLSDWIWEIDQNSVYTYVSPKVQDLLGYDPQEVLSKTPFDFMPPEEAQRVADVFGSLVADRQPLVRLENMNRHKDGHLVVFETSGVPFYDAEGRFKGYRGTDRDITERKWAEEEIRKLNEELEQRVIERTAQLEASNKELEAFSYSVSHDLRAPLRAVDGFSRILLEDYAPQLPSEVGRYLKTIRESSQQMGRLIDDLLRFSRLSRQSLNKQPIAVADLVRQALDSLSGEQQGRQIEITIGELPVCHGDSGLLRQVWINLLSNALKFTRGQEVARIEVGCMDKEGETVYFVQDNGAGFDMQYAGKLFGVFQRLHSAQEYEGTGVGLAIVQRIVRRHGGRVWAEGKVEYGATFYFTLPQKGAGSCAL